MGKWNMEKVYQVVEAVRKDKLEEKVNELLLSKEWVVVGGVSLSKTDSSFILYTQALVKNH